MPNRGSLSAEDRKIRDEFYCYFENLFKANE